MFENLAPTGVGDMAAYETMKREQKRKELISSFRELYGDNMPADAVLHVDRKLTECKSIFGDGDDKVEVDAEVVQFLLWRSVKKNNPDVTLEQVGQNMDIASLGKYIEQLMPSGKSVGELEKNEVAPSSNP
jgi:hypothetical protein